MSDIVDITRVKELINQSSFTSSEDDTIENLIDAVSNSIRRFTKRQLTSTSFDHVYPGNDDHVLILDEYPVTVVERVSATRKIALNVKNALSTNQRAQVRVISTGIQLFTVASGVTTSEAEITFSSNVTISAIRDAIIAKGNGWTAEIPDSDFALWASSELAPPMGRYNTDSSITPSGDRNAKDVWAPLYVWTDELSDYQVRPGNGVLIRNSSNNLPSLSTVWERGRDYRVKFTAGYSTIPEDLQHAAAEWVTTLFWLSKDNPAVYPDSPSPSIAEIMTSYRRR